MNDCDRQRRADAKAARARYAIRVQAEDAERRAAWWGKTHQERMALTGNQAAVAAELALGNQEVAAQLADAQRLGVRLAEEVVAALVEEGR